MLARAQQALFILHVTVATLLLVVTWRHSAILAVTLFAATMLAHSVLLAAQFAALPWLCKDGTVPAPGLWSLVRAWKREVIAATRVFFWWQPFRSRAHPDRLSGPGRGAVFVHGFLCNRGVWSLWLSELERRQTPFSAINLEPSFDSIDHYVDALERSICAMAQETGELPLIVCHSMGGLVARAWLRKYEGSGRIHRIVTIGTPHQGTSLAKRLWHPSAALNASQMRRGSKWLSQLAQSETPAVRQQITCYYSDSDNIVTPASSAMLDGADNRPAFGLPHIAMALDPGIMRETLAMLQAQGPQPLGRSD